MHEKYLVLERTIQRDLQAIQRIFEDIGDSVLTSESGEETLIVLAYRLHSLYNAFENIFQNIAAAFENQLEDSSHWRSQLLQRMALDVMPIRPSVIDKTAYETLDELRRFRHLFRYSYDVDLDVQRLSWSYPRLCNSSVFYPSQIEQFLEYLRGLAAEE